MSPQELLRRWHFISDLYEHCLISDGVRESMRQELLNGFMRDTNAPNDPSKEGLK